MCLLFQTITCVLLGLICLVGTFEILSYNNMITKCIDPINIGSYTLTCCPVKDGGLICTYVTSKIMPKVMSSIIEIYNKFK